MNSLLMLLVFAGLSLVTWCYQVDEGLLDQVKDKLFSGPYISPYEGVEEKRGDVDYGNFGTMLQSYGLQRYRRGGGAWSSGCSGKCYCYSKVTHRSFCCDCMTGPCFPGHSHVTRYPGGEEVEMERVKVGDVISTVSDGEVVGTQVVAFLDRRPQETAEYLRLEMRDGSALSISSGHLVYTLLAGTELTTKYAGDVEVGETVMIVMNGNATSPVEVETITRHLMTGAYVPLTTTGDLVVDGVLVSSYATFPHQLCHILLTPLRCGLVPPTLAPSLVGILKGVGRSLLPDHIVSQHHTMDIIKSTIL